MNRRVAVCCAVLLLSLCPIAPAVTLYDASLNTAPESQGWLFYFADAAIGGKNSAGGKTSFDSGDQNTRGGWSNTFPIINTLVNSSFPVLDRADGFTLSFDLRVITESHANSDRAGFSIILLGSDHLGIELGFWTDEIWQQSGPAFTHGHGKAFDTTVLTHYDLTIAGDNYELLANGASILSGTVVDYSSGLAVPYGLGNYLFFGDNTTSATASVEFGDIRIVPEPSLALAAIAGLLVLRRRGRADNAVGVRNSTVLR